MKENAGRSLGVHFGVSLCPLEFIKSLNECATISRLSDKSRCMRNSTDKDNLWGTSTRGLGSLLGSNVNLGISLNGRKALQVKVIVKTTELKKMVESRPNVSTTGSNKVQNIRRSIIVNLGEIGSESTENTVEIVTNSISGINNAEKSMANNTLRLGDISETERPLALHFPINFANFDIKDAMSTVYATNLREEAWGFTLELACALSCSSSP